MASGVSAYTCVIMSVITEHYRGECKCLYTPSLNICRMGANCKSIFQLIYQRKNPLNIRNERRRQIRRERERKKQVVKKQKNRLIPFLSVYNTAAGRIQKFVVGCEAVKI